MSQNGDFKWPWWQQATDVIATLLGVGIAIAMTIRNSYPVSGVALIALCIGKLSSSQLLKLLLGRWENKP